MDVFKLLDACCVARDNSAFIPTSSTTYCNIGVRTIAEAMGCFEFKQNMQANDMIEFMDTNSKFRAVDLVDAQGLANGGNLIIAGERQQPHGHVCVIRPGAGVFSVKWNVHVPMIVNIGATNFIGKGLNWSFKEPPKIWMWLP